MLIRISERPWKDQAERRLLDAFRRELDGRDDNLEFPEGLLAWLITLGGYHPKFVKVACE